MSGDTAPVHDWKFVTNHLLVVLCIAEDPNTRMVDVAKRVGVTERAIQGIDWFLAEDRAPLDLRMIELEEACRALGRIVGRDVDAEVLDQIFAEFCIGK